MATRSVEFEFMCGEGGLLTVNRDLPASLIQAASSGTSPAFRQAYVQAVAPVMQLYQEDCRKLSQAKCSVCDVSKTTQVLTTPMSYLHLSQPKIVVFVTPICEKQQCEFNGKAMVNELLMETTGLQPGQMHHGGATPRNAHCPCGSSRKYKKCCGSATASDDVD